MREVLICKKRIFGRALSFKTHPEKYSSPGRDWEMPTGPPLALSRWTERLVKWNRALRGRSRDVGPTRQAPVNCFARQPCKKDMIDPYCSSRESVRECGSGRLLRSRQRVGVLVWLVLAGLAPLAWAQQSETTAPVGADRDGGEIYAARCARCHGERGQGTGAYKAPLTGEMRVPQLAELIRETMPEDDPGSLPEAQAEKVAAYIHEAFYSPIAQARSQPARIERARLSVPQYRQTLADVMLQAAGGQWVDDSRRGLTGSYVDGRNAWNRKQTKLERIDPVIDFDFGTDVPVPQVSDSHQFSIRWNGALRAPESGMYRIVIRSQHAVKLILNSNEPLIDAMVKSVDEVESAARIYLVGGRSYPLYIEFSKAKQGVDDSKKRKQPPPDREAMIQLLWQRPGGVLKPIESRFLMPVSGPDVFVCSVPFPPDDASYGWVRATTVSPEWDQATTEGAIQAADYVEQNLDQWIGARKKDDAEQRGQRIREWCDRFVAAAFRRPLSDDERTFFIERQFQRAGSPEEAVKRIVLLTLKSPRFLFRELNMSEPWAVASRLSYTLWDSMPDAELFRAAEAGELDAPAGRRRQIERMMRHPLAEYKLGRFLRNWMQMDRERDLSKDPERYGGFDEIAMDDLRSSVELFIDEVIASPRADYRELILSDEIYLNRRLAELFQVEFPDDDGFRKVKLEPGVRAGILTHPYLMAQFAYRDETSPIHRGVFVSRKLLGQALRPPPEAFAPISPDLHPDLTTRERVSLQTRATQCMACHRVINPLGFALENFDAVGRFRTRDRDKPVDVTATLLIDGQEVTLRGSRDLAQFILNNERAQTAFCVQMFQFLVGQPVRAYGDDVPARLRSTFVTSDFNMRRLAEQIALIASQ